MPGNRYINVLDKIHKRPFEETFEKSFTSGTVCLSGLSVAVESGKFAWSTDSKPFVSFEGPVTDGVGSLFAQASSAPGSVIEDDELSELLVTDSDGRAWRFTHIYPTDGSEKIMGRPAITITRAQFGSAVSVLSKRKVKYLRVILRGTRLEWLPIDQQMPMIMRLDGYYLGLKRLNKKGTTLALICPIGWATTGNIRSLCSVLGIASSRATYIVAEEAFDAHGKLVSVTYYDRFNSERNSFFRPIPWEFSISRMDGTKGTCLFAKYQAHTIMCLYRGFSKYGNRLGIDVAYEHCVAAVGQSPAATFGSYSIALESLVSAWSSNMDSQHKNSGNSYSHPTIVTSAEFIPIREAVQSSILRVPGNISKKGARKRLASEQNVNGLNRLGWMQKVENFFDSNAISISKTDKSTIKKRNDVLHNGRLSGSEKDAQKAFLMQGRMATLVFRAMLVLLGYRGPVHQFGEIGFPEIGAKSGLKLRAGGRVRLTDLMYFEPETTDGSK